MRLAAVALLATACSGGGGSAGAQDQAQSQARDGRAPTRAPAGAPSEATAIPAGEPGEPLVVEGTVVAADGSTPVAGASVYAYHTDVGGEYGPGGSRDPRLRAYLRTDAGGRFRIVTIKPGSYPQGGVAAHIHFHFAPPEGGGERVTEVVFEGDPQITAGMRANHAFAVLPLERGADGGLVVRYRVLLDG
jgi:protocatechuate 3,4-dioxygenase beta subunit